MKLLLGENIRRLRRSCDLTQEQLADRLGVTYQSVSRWENCTAYPDIELLPAISEIFSVSVDELLGVPETEKERKAEALCEEFRSLRNKSVPEEKREEWLKSLAEIIRRLRVDYAGCDAVWKFWLNCYDWRLRLEPLLSEVRLFAEARLEKYPGDADIIGAMAVIEDDEHLEEFLKRHATSHDLSRDALLLNRYIRRGEEKKASPLRQQRLYMDIDDAVSSGVTTPYPKHNGDVGYAYAANTAQLGILHSFAEESPTPEHPISCGAAHIDFWALARIELGIDRVYCLSGLGRTEEAFTALEDTVSLLERVMEITDKTELPTSRFTPDIKWYAKESWDKGWVKSEEHPKRLERNVIIDSSNNCCYLVFPANILRRLTTEWADASARPWLDAVRSDSRYQGYIDRVQRLLLTKDPDEDKSE